MDKWKSMGIHSTRLHVSSRTEFHCLVQRRRQFSILCGIKCKVKRWRSEQVQHSDLQFFCRRHSAFRAKKKKKKARKWVGQCVTAWTRCFMHHVLLGLFWQGFSFLTFRGSELQTRCSHWLPHRDAVTHPQQNGTAGMSSYFALSLNA